MMNASLQNRQWNLLIAEDDDDDFLIFQIALEESKVRHKLERAKNGEVLLKLLSQSVPDILFLDLNMPCKDGHQCLQEIRADSRYDSLPVVVYSSRNDPKSVDRCYRSGSNFFTVKPDTVNDLTAVLKHLFRIDWKSNLFYPTKGEFLLRANQIN